MPHDCPVLDRVHVPVSATVLPAVQSSPITESSTVGRIRLSKEQGAPFVGAAVGDATREG